MCEKIPSLAPRFRSGWKEVLALVGLLGLAAGLRLWRLDLMEFKHDEAVAWLRARALVEGLKFPMVGLVSSTGLENCPLFLCVLALASVVFRDPVALAGVIAVAGSIAPLLAFAATRRLLDARTAWPTALFCALSPCAVVFSRKIWAQDLLPLWSTSILLCLACLLSEDSTRRRRQGAAFSLGLLAITSCQIHYAAVFLILGVAAVLAVNRRRIGEWKALVWGGCLGAVPFLPWLLHQFQTGGGGLRALGETVADPKTFRLKELIVYFVRQPADEGIHGLLGNEYVDYLDALPGARLTRIALSGLVVAGGGICLWRAWRGTAEQRRASRILLLLTALPLALLGATRLPLIPSYFLVFYPLPCLLAAMPLSSGWARMERMEAFPSAAAMALGCVVLVALCSYQIAATCTFHAQITRRGGSTGEYGIAYAYTREAGAWVAATIPARRVAEATAFLDLPVLAAAVAERGRTVQAPKIAVAADHTLLVLDRRRYPVLDAEAELWVVGGSAAYHFLLGPPEEIGVLAAACPNALLTPRQKAESHRATRLAQRLLQVDYAR